MSRRLLSLARLLAITGLAVSVVILVNRLGSRLGLCGYDSGCHRVMAGRVGDVLPVIGVLTFAVYFMSTLVSGSWPTKLRSTLALLLGCGGAALIVMQVAIIQQVCPYCLIVDAAGVGIGLITFVGGAPQPISSRIGERIFWVAVSVAVVAESIGIAASGSQAPVPSAVEVPPEVRALWAPGKTNVVEVVDFECEQCRRMHAIVQYFVREQGERVHFVELAGALPNHRQARGAARAYLCAQDQGKGAAMANKLFMAESVDVRDCDEIAASIGVSMDSFRTCVQRPDIDKRLDDTMAWVRTASPNGLPVVWVQDRVIFGVRPLQALRMAMDLAEQDKQESQPCATTDSAK
jgi:predicted DsbA family dithiol-disulfide isomerase/uncharacterized membrane protein